MGNTRQCAEVAALIAAAEKILFITGAGISADSGLPTYRGIGGLYDDRMTDDGMSIETALSGRMLNERPEVTWKYLAEIEANCRDAAPNIAHSLLAELERRRDGIWVLTQNIDGLHRAAGSRNLIEVHGCLQQLSCTACSYRVQLRNFEGLTIPPQCPACRAMARPDVVLFGEMLPEDAISRLGDILDQGVDLVVSIGTSSIFPYIAGPVVWANQQGLPTVEINPGETSVSRYVSYPLRMRAAEALPAIWQHLNMA